MIFRYHIKFGIDVLYIANMGTGETLYIVMNVSKSVTLQAKLNIYMELCDPWCVVSQINAAITMVWWRLWVGICIRWTLLHVHDIG